MTRFFAIAVLALTGVALAQPATIIAEKNGTVVASTSHGGDLVVPIGDMTADTLVRVYDSNSSATSPPTLSLRSLRIEGTRSGGTLQVLIAASTTTVFPGEGDSRVAIDEGLVEFGVDQFGESVATSLSIINPSNSSDHSLRNASVFAMGVTHNTSGSIDVGRRVAWISPNLGATSRLL